MSFKPFAEATAFAIKADACPSARNSYALFFASAILICDY